MHITRFCDKITLYICGLAHPPAGDPAERQDYPLERDTKIIAVAGKGGVGKTSISSAFVRLLTEAYPQARILAIDADPAVGLSTALGV